MIENVKLLMLDTVLDDALFVAETAYKTLPDELQKEYWRGVIYAVKNIKIGIGSLLEL